MIKTDFTDTDDLTEISENLSFVTFFSPDTNNTNVLIKVRISILSDPSLPNVYNLAFGPLSSDGNIDDHVRIPHTNLGKLFSTILLFCFTFLQTYPERKIGLDGSDDVRAYLYHRMFKTNREYLNKYFRPFGVDWFVKLLRSGSVEVDIEGLPYFKPKTEPFDYERPSTNMYRYYLLTFSD